MIYKTLVAFVLFLFTHVSADNLLTIAVNDLAGQNVDESGSVIISDRLRSELVNTGKFRVMERSKMEEILKEQGFQKSGACTDNSCMVEIGQLLGVQQIVTGTVGKIGRLYTINVRVIDVATGQILTSVNSDCKCEISDVLTKSTPAIAKQLETKLVKPAHNQAAVQTTTVSKNQLRSSNKNILTRWYFWTPLSVAVAGGLGYFLLSKPNSQNPEQPSQTNTGGLQIQW